MISEKEIDIVIDSALNSTDEAILKEYSNAVLTLASRHNGEEKNIETIVERQVANELFKHLEGKSPDFHRGFIVGLCTMIKIQMQTR